MMETDYNNPYDDFVRHIDIHTLLPQQEPFIMIGTLLHFDMKHTVTSMTIQESSIFTEDGIFSASGLVENIAQTCAARIGYINKYILKKGIQIGFIGAIRDMEILSLPKAGDVITTEVTVKEEVFGIVLISALITKGDEVMAKAEMKIAVKDEEA